MVEKLRNFQGYHKFRKKRFVNWISKKLEEEWSVNFSKDVGLQLGALLNITLLHWCFLCFAISYPNLEHLR